MKKTNVRAAVLVLAFAALLLSACSKKKEVSIDTAKLAGTLTEQTVTSDTLTELASSMLSTVYFIKDDVLAGGNAYLSAGSTACEVAVIECKSADQCKSVEELFQQRVKTQSELYASYNAGEVEKLNNAIIKSAGPYVVLCVCDDSDKAASILKENGF